MWVVIDISRERPRQSTIALTRAPMPKEMFLDIFEVDGIAPDCATFVWEQVQPYYFGPLTPQPDDRFDSFIHGDPDDLEDRAAAFWRLRGAPMPSLRDPAVIPQDPTLLALAIGWTTTPCRQPDDCRHRPR